MASSKSQHHRPTGLMAGKAIDPVPQGSPAEEEMQITSKQKASSQISGRDKQSDTHISPPSRIKIKRPQSNGTTSQHTRKRDHSPMEDPVPSGGANTSALSDVVEATGNEHESTQPPKKKPRLILHTSKRKPSTPAHSDVAASAGNTASPCGIEPRHSLPRSSPNNDCDAEFDQEIQSPAKESLQPGTPTWQAYWQDRATVDDTE